MKIICPQCQFTRQVPAEKMPKASTMATCPQCQCRFKVHVHEGEEGQISIEKVTQESVTTSQAGQPVQTQRAQESAQEQQRPKTITKYSPPKENTHAESAHAAYAREQEAAQKTTQQEQAQQQEEEDVAFAAFALDNPWENPEPVGYFSAFYQTVLRVLFSAPRFFAGLLPQSSQKRALVFFVIVGLLQITFERFWGDVISEALAPTAAEDPQLQALLSMLTPQSSYSLALLLGGALSIVELFFTTTVYFLLFRLITPQRAHFNLIFQVVAYGSAPMLLCLVPALGSVVGFIWSIACTAVGCRYAMRLTWGQTLLGILPVYAIGVPLILQFLFSA